MRLSRRRPASCVAGTRPSSAAPSRLPMQMWGRRSPSRSTARPCWPHVQQQRRQLQPRQRWPPVARRRPANHHHHALHGTDNAGATSTTNLVITVTGTNDARWSPNANTVAATEDNYSSPRPRCSAMTPTSTAAPRWHHQRAGCGQRYSGTGRWQRGRHHRHYNGPASFTYTVSDGNGGTANATVTVNVAAVTRRSTACRAQAINEDTAARVLQRQQQRHHGGGHRQRLADHTLSAANGTLTLGSTAGVTVTGNGNGTVTITGSAAAINTALNGTTFAPTANYSGSTTVTVSTTRRQRRRHRQHRDQHHAGRRCAQPDDRRARLDGLVHQQRQNGGQLRTTPAGW